MLLLLRIPMSMVWCIFRWIKVRPSGDVIDYKVKAVEICKILSIISKVYFRVVLNAVLEIQKCFSSSSFSYISRFEEFFLYPSLYKLYVSFKNSKTCASIWRQTTKGFT